MKPMKTAVQMPNLERVYPNYVFEGPLFTPHGSAYLLMTPRDSADSLTLYMRYEYALMTNIQGTKLRGKRKVIFKDGNPFNYNRINLKSIVENGVEPPFLGWGIFKTISSIDLVYQMSNASYAYTPPKTLPPNGQLKKVRDKTNILEAVPDILTCGYCKKPIVLSRFQKYSYIKHNKRSFMHDRCAELNLQKLRPLALSARRAKKAGAEAPIEFITLRIVHYAAKKPLSGADVSTRGEAFFNANYHNVGKDYLVDEILAQTTAEMPLCSPDTVVESLVHKALNMRSELIVYKTGATFILYEVANPKRRRNGAKELIHASW